MTSGGAATIACPIPLGANTTYTGPLLWVTQVRGAVQATLQLYSMPSQRCPRLSRAVRLGDRRRHIPSNDVFADDQSVDDPVGDENRLPNGDGVAERDAVPKPNVECDSLGVSEPVTHGVPNADVLGEWDAQPFAHDHDDGLSDAK